MCWIERNKEGKIVTVLNNWRDGSTEMADDHPEVLAFRNRDFEPPEPPKPPVKPPVDDNDFEPSGH